MIIKSFYPTKFYVADNSGVLLVKNISNFSKNNIGNVITWKVLNWTNKSKIKRHKIIKGLIINIKKNIFIKKLGVYIKSWINSIIIINSQFNPVGTRIFFVIFKDLFINNSLKILSIAKHVI